MSIFRLTCSQFAETFSGLLPLFQYAQSKPELTPKEALQQFVTQAQNQNQFPQSGPFHTVLQPSQNGVLQLPPGSNPSQFVSPASAAHLNLPVNTSSASPATLNMSPAMQNIGLNNHLQNNTQQLQQPHTSVGMVAQQSQQGTNTSVGTGSQGTSANASPNVNKRRRQSGVKVEADDGGGNVETNGTVTGGSKVKQSPRPGVKRQKGNG